jgi:hypothetical protein
MYAHNNKYISFKIVAAPSLTFAILGSFVRFADAIRRVDSACSSTSTDDTDKRSEFIRFWF